MSSDSDQPKFGRKHQFLLRIERFSRKNYRLVFILALLALVGGIWLGGKLTLESNVLSLIPEGNAKVDKFKEALLAFGSIDYLILLLEDQAGTGPDALKDFADEMAGQLAEHEDLVERVDYRLDLDSEFLQLFYRNALLFLPPGQLPELGAKLTDEAIRDQLRQDWLMLASPTGTLTEELIINDPLALMPLFLNRVVKNRGLFQIDLADGYYLSRDRQTLIMLIKPTGPSQDLEFSKKVVGFVESIEQETRTRLAEDLRLEDAGELGVHVRYGGNYAVAVDEQKLIKQDVTQNLVVSLLAVSLLYWLCYRRFAALLYSSLPLMVGQALTFGLAFFALGWSLTGWKPGTLNAASSAFTALLMGLGTDFVIVMYARYVEERQKGKGLAEATELMIGETGLGVFTGAITSAGTFYAMCISQFRGLRDLGFLIGSGILMCAVAIIFMLPAMIKWNEGVRRRKVDSVKKLHLQSFTLEYLIPFSARHRVPVLIVVGLLTAGGAYAAFQLDFADTIRVLRSNRSPSFKVQQDMAERFGVSLSYMMAIAEAPTREEAVALTEKIAQRLQPFTDDGTVTSYDSVLTYLPPEADQREVLLALESDQQGAFDPARIHQSFRRGLEENNFRDDAFADFQGHMEAFLTPARPLSLADLEQQGLARLLDRYVRVDQDAEGQDRVRIVTYMFLSDPRWKRRAPPGLSDALTQGDAGIVVTGTNVVGAEFRRIFMTEAPRAVLLGLLVVFVLLWIDFRSLRLTAIALTQLVCGVTIMLGMMRAVGFLHPIFPSIPPGGIALNYVNAFVATMILGVGIDYSIHLVHRLHLSGGRIEHGLLETGKAVVMAALTNIAGFGTLIAGNYPALRSFGTVALFGSVACLFTALTLVPALMARTDSSET